MKKPHLLISFVLIMSVFFASDCRAAENIYDTDDIRESEQRITEKISEQIEKQIPRVRDPETEKKLSDIAAGIKSKMGRDISYEVRIIKRDDPHSFSLPGGLTYITTGMLAFLKSDDETAAVIAREFTHCDLSHWRIQSSRNDRIGFQTIAEVAAATQSGKVAGNMLRSYLNRAVINFYDIDLEKEADKKALKLLESTGYDKTAMLTFLERMRVERLKQIYVRGIDIKYRSSFKPLEMVMETMKLVKKKDDKKITDPIRTDMIQVNSDMEERVEALLKYFKDNNIEIKRKYAVNILRVSIAERSGKIHLKIDRTEVASADKKDSTERIFNIFKTRLDRDLQLETPMYDIQVQKFLGIETLLISGRVLLGKKDLTDGMQGLSHIRDRIIKALTEARKENFLTDYYE